MAVSQARGLAKLIFFVKRIATLEEFVGQKINERVLKNKNRIENIQRKRLKSGKNVAEETMQKGYSPGYAKKRKKSGLQTNYVDLNFTGEFYQSLDLVEEADYGKFDVISDVSYAPFIMEKYGKIVGLTDTEAETIKKIITKGLKKEIKKYLLK